MPEWLQPILDWIAANPAIAGVVIFALVAFEGFLIVGLFIPGTIVMFSLGTIVATGALELTPTLLWAAIGACFGDSVSYFVGRHYQERLATFPLLRTKPTLLEGSRKFFTRHGGKSVVLGRFIGPMRPLVPAVAGMAGMSPLRFILINFFASLAWSPSYMLPGVIFGTSVSLLEEVGTRIVIALAVVVGGLWLAWWIVVRAFYWLQPRTAGFIERMVQWSDDHPKLGHVSAAVTNPEAPELRGLTVLGALLLALFWFIYLLLWLDSQPANIDTIVFNLAQGLRNPVADEIAIFISHLLDWPALLVLAVVTLAMTLRRSRLAAVHWLAACTFAGFGFTALLLWPAPPTGAELYLRADGQLPGGSLLLAQVVLSGFLAVLLEHELPAEQRWVGFAIVSSVLVCAVLAGLYLGRLWFSDVLIGLFIGLAAAVILGIAYEQHASQPPFGKRPLLIACAAVLIPGGLFAWQQHEPAKLAYAPPAQAAVTTLAQWRAQDWQIAPGQQQDLQRQDSAPLVIQYQGDLETLQATLLEQGWQQPLTFDLKGAFLLLRENANIKDLPLLPHVHNGQYESLSLTLPTDNPQTQTVLRLWPTEQLQLDTQQPLWLGTISRQKVDQLMDFISYGHTTQTIDQAGLQALQQALPTLQSQLVTTTTLNQPRQALLIWGDAPR